MLIGSRRLFRVCISLGVVVTMTTTKMPFGVEAIFSYFQADW